MHSASAPAPPAYDVCTPDQWDAWYTTIGVLGDGGTDFGLLETSLCGVGRLAAAWPAVVGHQGQLH
jgi:hypothetical protein